MSNASRDACFIFGIPWSPTSAERAWTRRMLVGSGGLVCAGGRLYGADGRGEIAGLVTIDAATGVAAAAHAPGWLSASGAMVWADGRLYCLTPRERWRCWNRLREASKLPDRLR
jgi:hypothetical protein